MRKIIIVILLSGNYVLQGCSTGGDYTEELSGDYFFRAEGEDLNDILSHNPDAQEIPANIISYGYDSNFIIAAQKPDKTEDPLYSRTYTYKEGRDKVYYWLISHNPKKIIGPLKKWEFIVARKELGVPDNLNLNVVN